MSASSPVATPADGTAGPNIVWLEHGKSRLALHLLR